MSQRRPFLYWPTFSAPVKINFDYSLEELGFLSRHDSDGFNRWEAGQRLSIALIGALESGTNNEQLEEAKEAFKAMMRHHLAAASESTMMR